MMVLKLSNIWDFLLKYIVSWCEMRPVVLWTMRVLSDDKNDFDKSAHYSHWVCLMGRRDIWLEKPDPGLVSGTDYFLSLISEYWLLIGRYRSRDLNTDFWLVDTGHVTWILASDWSIQKLIPFPDFLTRGSLAGGWLLVPQLSDDHRL